MEASSSTISDISQDQDLRIGKELYKTYESEVKIATQHIKTDILTSKYTLSSKLMIYAAIRVEGQKNASFKPVMTRGGKMSAPMHGGMCTIKGPFPTPVDTDNIASLLKDLFGCLQTNMKKVAKTDTRARLTLKLIKQKTDNVKRLMPSFDPYSVLNPHVNTLSNYLEEVVFHSSGVFPNKFIPLLVVYFDINAKPPRCNYEILVVNNPLPEFIKYSAISETSEVSGESNSQSSATHS